MSDSSLEVGNHGGHRSGKNLEKLAQEEMAGGLSKAASCQCGGVKLMIMIIIIRKYFTGIFNNVQTKINVCVLLYIHYAYERTRHSSL